MPAAAYTTTYVELRLLGTPELLAEGTPVTIERRKALALLAYIALEPGPHPRDRLATLLAPDDDPIRARAGLRRALAVLTPTLRAWLSVSSETIALQRSSLLHIDVDRFVAVIEAHAQPKHDGDPPPPEERALLEEALSLARGELLDGFHLPNSSNFEEWQQFQADRIRRLLILALDRLTVAGPDSDLPRLVDHARRRVTLDPLDETGQRRLMQLYTHAGQAGAAMRQYRSLIELLERELGVAPAEETTALYEKIRLGDRGTASSTRWNSVPPRLPAAPAPITPAIDTPALPFVGRQAELAQIAAALRNPDCRLLTLIGPGGMGKTRLAHHAAQHQQEYFPDGVYQVSLVGITTPDRLLSTIALALGLAGQGDPLEQLSSLLRDRRALLLLDNVDQVVEGAPLLSMLLRRTRHLTLLATSRERLQLQEEWVIELPGLAVPASAAVEVAAGYSAVALFLQRARQVRPEIRGAEELPAIIEICRLVEGMPLALELAAAWVRVLTPAEIARDLAQSMALLTTTLRNVPERHRSVVGVFAQSWERLSHEERTGLQRLSVFEQGYTRAAAAEVAGAGPVVLAGLADKALVRRDRSGRYMLHELLRQFTAGKLAEHPDERHETIRRYCIYYGRMLEQRGQDIQGAHQRQALAELDVEFDNLWQAWTWIIEERFDQALAAGLDGIYRLCEVRGWYSDGILALDLLIQRFGQIPSRTPDEEIFLARAQARQAALRCWTGQFDLARQLLHEAMPVLQAYGVTSDVAFAHIMQGTVAYERSDDATARRELESGLAINQTIGNESGVAWAFDMLGDLAGSLGHYDEARDWLTQSITLSSSLGDQISTAWSLCGLGRVLRLMGDHAEARQLLEESRELFTQLDDQHGLASAYASLGELSYAAGDRQAAREHWLSALRYAREVRAVPLVLDAFIGLALVAADLGEAEEARELAVLVLAHPASWQESLTCARQVIQITDQALDPAIVAQITRRARVTTWEAAAAQVLGETKGNNTDNI